ncbi:13302_t:CDS:2 [Acaulospora colombiana]|uniref:13302_t:CDS:1 n=1 Tax=Acaulospora colombiana TaxID=27376 RepID=A0ACA9NJ16_9GLOM|nr:13302_t:CDS:2 [Acaulospora colombiana]
MECRRKARLLPISGVSQDDIGDKIRVYGYLTLPEDATSAIALVHSPRAKLSSPQGMPKPGDSKPKPVRQKGSGLLVDLSLCLSGGNDLLRESGFLVMAVGNLESMDDHSLHEFIRTSERALRISIDDKLILRLILLREARNNTLKDLEDAIVIRNDFEKDQGNSR